jgi:glucose-1-phosphate thymidylyltransferase
VIKPAQTLLRYTWIIAAWTPTFSRFMHEYLGAAQTGQDPGFSTDPGQPGEEADFSLKEVFVGHVIQAAIEAGLRVGHVFFPNERYLDIGTPDNLVKAIQWIAESGEQKLII